MEKTQAVQLIQDLSNANGVSGFEEEVVALVKKATSEFSEARVDGIKNLYLSRPQNTGKRPVLQFDAHSDEVGMMIQAVKENGLMAFLTVGGWVPANLTAQKVRIRNRDGRYVPGIVTSKPPHFITAEERKKAIELKDLFIDVGATSAEEVTEVYKIDIGAPIVPDVTCVYDEETDKFLGKAFDCRIGVACMVDVLSELAEDDLPFDLVSTLSAQEEVGERGTKVAAKQVQADLSIVFEGCPADDTEEPYKVQSGMGRGPMLRNFDISMITNPEWQAYAGEIAKKFDIPMQTSVRSGGGTNGAIINLVKGAPTIVVGIPVRYAHTPHCFIDYKDYQAAKQLVLEIVRSLDEATFDRCANPLGGLFK